MAEEEAWAMKKSRAFCSPGDEIHMIVDERIYHVVPVKELLSEPNEQGLVWRVKLQNYVLELQEAEGLYGSV